MPQLSATTHVDATPERVFAHVDDPDAAPGLVEGLTRWAPLGEQQHGVGAAFAAALKVGPRTVDGELRTIESVPGRRLAWAASDGFPLRIAWDLAPAAGGTDVTFTVEVTPPGGLAGRLLAKTVEPAIRSSVDRTVATLKRQVEAQTAAG